MRLCHRESGQRGNGRHPDTDLLGLRGLLGSLEGLGAGETGRNIHSGKHTLLEHIKGWQAISDQDVAQQVAGSILVDRIGDECDLFGKGQLVVSDRGQQGVMFVGGYLYADVTHVVGEAVDQYLDGVSVNHREHLAGLSGVVGDALQASGQHVGHAAGGLWRAVWRGRGSGRYAGAGGDACGGRHP